MLPWVLCAEILGVDEGYRTMHSVNDVQHDNRWYGMMDIGIVEMKHDVKDVKLCRSDNL